MPNGNLGAVKKIKTYAGGRKESWLAQAWGKADTNEPDVVGPSECSNSMLEISASLPLCRECQGKSKKSIIHQLSWKTDELRGENALTELLDVASTSQVDNGGWLRPPAHSWRSLWAYNDSDILVRHGNLGEKQRQGSLRLRVEGTHQRIREGEDARGQERRQDVCIIYINVTLLRIT